MDWYALVWRTVVMYIVVFIVMRLMGKREIGKLSVIDLVISFMIAEIAVIEIEDADNNLTHGLIPIFTLLAIQVITAYVSIKHRGLRLLMDGKPAIIIANGKIEADQLRKHRYTLDDLMLQLRENGYADINEVDFAILETSGKLSVIAKEKINQSVYGQTASKSNSQPPTEDMSTTQANRPEKKLDEHIESIIPAGFRYEMLPIPLIMDGRVMDENLESIKKTRFWLKNIVQEHGGTNFKEVLLCTIDHRNKIYLDLMDKPE